MLEHDELLEAPLAREFLVPQSDRSGKNGGKRTRPGYMWRSFVTCRQRSQAAQEPLLGKGTHKGLVARSKPKDMMHIFVLMLDTVKKNLWRSDAVLFLPSEREKKKSC